MNNIIIEKHFFPILLANYDWKRLGDTSKSTVMDKTVLKSIISQFSHLYIFQNDTIWGNYIKNQKILIGRAPNKFESFRKKEIMN